MTKEQLEALTQRYLSAAFDEIEARLALDWSQAGLDEYSSQLNERAHQLSALLATVDVSETIDHARELAPEADEQAQRILARRLIESQMEAAKAELRALAGEPLRRPNLLSAAPPQPLPASTPRLSEIARLFCEERIARGSWTAKTAHQNKGIFDVIVDLLGDPEVGSTTKSEIRQLGLDLAKLPSNMGKRFPGRTAREVLELAAEHPTAEPLAPRSINKYYQNTRTLFDWAVEHDHIATSPATVLKDVETGRAQDAREAFTDEEIAKLFASISARNPEPFGIWIPRIMAFTGCRMGEAAQLRKADIREVDGIWVFDINEDSDEKNLKTTAARRLVPVHDRLIELGLLDFVAACQEQFLFPEKFRLTRNATRGNVDNLSKKLNYWLRAAGITQKKKTFQSFRATLATKLKSAGAHEYQIAQIIGHENNNITTGRYGKDVDLRALSSVINLARVPVTKP